MEEHEEEDEGAVVASDAISAVIVPTHVETHSSTTPHHGDSSSSQSGLDFIGPSTAVKNLFAAPYSGAVNVAIHNVDGTLLIDAAADPERITEQVAQQEAKQHKPFLFHIPQYKEEEQEQRYSIPEEQQLIALPDKQQNDALATITALLQSTREKHRNETDETESSDTQHNLSNPGGILPPPEHYAGKTVVPHEPREYLPWQFQNMNLLVGSDTLVYRPQHQHASEESLNSQALTVRVADASDLRVKLQQYEEAVRLGQFVPDYYRTQQQQKPKSYADVVTPPPQLEQQQQPGTNTAQQSSDGTTQDSTMLRLQTCVVPSRNVMGAGMIQTDPALSAPSASNTVCTVLDAYLDNIIANVPQLALCLYEKRFIQSIKLLQTQDIPSALMHPTTLDVNSPVVASTDGKEPLFSPQVMEMNASMLMRFLRSNCTRNNATYLLRREEGQTHIQLYDVSSVSAQRQRKWIWWLAMMSYRFAVRLGQLSRTPRFHASEKRSFRARQRSLLRNALELLQDLNDRDGPAHETFCAAVCENLADTFLGHSEDDDTVEEEDPLVRRQQQSTTLSFQPYSDVSGDALNKAQDHLVTGIRTLWPLLEKHRQPKSTRRRRKPKSKTSGSGRRVVVVVHTEGSSSSSSGSEDETDDDEDENSSIPMAPLSMEAEAATMQLFGLHHKLINVNLRLADHHLHNYWSSSAMQALRTAARRIADAVALLRSLSSSSRIGAERIAANKESSPDYLDQLRRNVMFQYAWLWEQCGFFARSFAADELWRDRGHCCGDDIVSLLRDVEAACSTSDTRDDSVDPRLSREAPISKRTNQQATLNSLSAVVTTLNSESKAPQKHSEPSVTCDPAALEAARAVLDRQKPIRRDERRVLVAASVSYSRSIGTFHSITEAHQTAKGSGGTAFADSKILGVLRQRFGDACNEIGKVLLTELRMVLGETEGSEQESSRIAAGPLLSAAQFWFLEGLRDFEECKDLRNVALLRCNLCQCCKLRANNTFSDRSGGSTGNTHAENCLQDAADHLQMAHETLGQRDVDPMTWDMVSEELAATFLVLGVRRRQSLLGSGSTPVIMQAMRLNPGKERSVVDPMERSLEIYKQSGNAHQAAAVHYQLALFYSKVWTCQRDASKTREKLSAAFQHYSAAHAYFSTAPRGEEPTFCILCLDLSNLYAAVSGQECLSKALDRCLDTAGAFSQEAIDAARARESVFASQWSEKMVTLASTIDERVFKHLLSLVKLEKELNPSDGNYKEIYRVALTAKATMKKAHNGEEETATRLTNVRDLLTTIKEKKTALLEP